MALRQSMETFYKHLNILEDRLKYKDNEEEGTEALPIEEMYNLYPKCDFDELYGKYFEDGTDILDIEFYFFRDNFGLNEITQPTISDYRKEFGVMQNFIIKYGNCPCYHPNDSSVTIEPPSYPFKLSEEMMINPFIIFKCLQGVNPMLPYKYAVLTGIMFEKEGNENVFTICLGR